MNNTLALIYLILGDLLIAIFSFVLYKLVSVGITSTLIQCLAYVMCFEISLFLLWLFIHELLKHTEG